MPSEDSIRRLLSELDSVKTDRLTPSPSLAEVAKVIYGLLNLMFPYAFDYPSFSGLSRVQIASRVFSALSNLLSQAFLFFDVKIDLDTEELAEKIINKLPDLKIKLLADADAIYRGDPSAIDRAEVIICYPGFFAIAVYRLSHELYTLGVPYLGRMMSEYAHSVTGIDIHPGAVIGESFFIDHGTGIVVGETTVIGDRVKIYHGVTLGAKSLHAEAQGRLLRGNKRHPSIGDDCIIYASATVLGGDTEVGRGCIIGSNVQINRSLAAGSKIFLREK